MIPRKFVEGLDHTLTQDDVPVHKQGIKQRKDVRLAEGHALLLRAELMEFATHPGGHEIACSGQSENLVPGAFFQTAHIRVVGMFLRRA